MVVPGPRGIIQTAVEVVEVVVLTARVTSAHRLGLLREEEGEAGLVQTVFCFRIRGIRETQEIKVL